MKNQIQVFTNSEFGEIRTLNINGEPWFAGKDVAEILGYERTTKAIVDRVDEDDRIMLDKDTQSQFRTELGQRGGWIINESGLYSLILSSKLPSAKKFKHWITAEVLPSIRKHGAYMTEDVLKQAITTPDFIIQLATALKEEQQARRSAEETLCKQKPLVDFAHQVSNTADLIDMNTMAKLLSDHGLSIGRNRLFRFLKEANILMDNGLPYQMYVDAGHFKVKESTYRDHYGNIHTNRQTLVTGKGQLYITKKVKELRTV
ncbi:MAG: phage antirepressor [Bacteroides sp.]|nr:phage antirepressor [Eubacterium sp.]MCM1418163.1 phage antirepressor [Roseburia sp.]MCM1462312.1 phage antirepressor [Bacteroides sp.]